MISVRRGALQDAETEGILRPVRSDLSPVTPGSRDVGIAAGPTVEERLSEIGEVPVGGAIITPGGELAASFLIHAVVHGPDEPVSARTVTLALTNGLRRATEWEIESLALPPLGVGAGQLDVEAAASLMLEVLQKHLAEAATLAEVVVIVASDFEETAFLRGV